MPAAAPDRPRKMLPPPITRQTSMPISTTARISSAMRETVVASRPYSRDPIRPSPDNLIKTRRNLGCTARSVVMLGLFLGGLKNSGRDDTPFPAAVFLKSLGNPERFSLDLVTELSRDFSREVLLFLLD